MTTRWSAEAESESLQLQTSRLPLTDSEEQTPFPTTPFSILIVDSSLFLIAQLPRIEGDWWPTGENRKRRVGNWKRSEWLEFSRENLERKLEKVWGNGEKENEMGVVQQLQKGHGERKTSRGKETFIYNSLMLKYIYIYILNFDN